MSRTTDHGIEPEAAPAPASASASPAPRRRPPGPTAKPAAVVFGIIFVVFLAGFIADIITSNHSPSTVSSSTTTPSAVSGTGGLVPHPSRSVVAAMVSTAGPPADVLAALVLPDGTAAVPGSVVDHALGLYDSTITVQIPAPEQDAIVFFRAELAAGRWRILSTGPYGGGYRFIAQHPSSDGYEWEAGITLSATSFRSAITGTTAPASGVTAADVRLYQTSDYS